MEEAFDVLQRLLLDTGISVRMGAAFLLATMIDRRADAVSAPLETIDCERDDSCRGALLLSLMIFAEQRPGDSLARVAGRRLETALYKEQGAHAERLGAGISFEVPA